MCAPRGYTTTATSSGAGTMIMMILMCDDNVSIYIVSLCELDSGDNGYDCCMNNVMVIVVVGNDDM